MTRNLSSEIYHLVSYIDSLIAYITDVTFFVVALIIVAVFVATAVVDHPPCSPGIGNHFHTVKVLCAVYLFWKNCWAKWMTCILTNDKLSGS